MQHKTGKGHNDFSDREAEYLEPSSRFRWQKPTVVLTNREVYSAANDFVKMMKCFPEVKTVGDQTGGGAGLPFTSTLPNGWTVRFSACPSYDRNGNQIEFGIAPDYSVGQTDEDFAGQWGYPNMWAPLVWFAFYALKAVGAYEEAVRIGKKYLLTVEDCFANNSPLQHI